MNKHEFLNGCSQATYTSVVEFSESFRAGMSPIKIDPQLKTVFGPQGAKVYTLMYIIEQLPES